MSASLLPTSRINPIYPSASSLHRGLFSLFSSSRSSAICFSESAFLVTDLNCNRIGDIFNQFANEDIIPSCSSSERSIKLMGSISRILIYLPSFVSMIPWRIFFTGIKSCTNSFFCLLIVRPPEMKLSLP